MTHKDGLTAICPKFVARVDHQSFSWIQCKGWDIPYFDRDERDAAYRAACCNNPDACPIRTLAPQLIDDHMEDTEP